MRKESKIFHRHLPMLVCMFGFLAFIVAGVVKLFFFHYWKFHFRGDRQSYRFLYHFGKALNHAACAGAFNGRNDETISNKTGRTYKAHGAASPLWVFAIKWITDQLDPPEEGRDCHILDSIEPLRPDLDEPEQKEKRDDQPNHA